MCATTTNTATIAKLSQIQQDNEIRLSHMEQRLHQTSMQQDNLSKVTANAVDAIARRVKHTPPYGVGTSVASRDPPGPPLRRMVDNRLDIFINYHNLLLDLWIY